MKDRLLYLTIGLLVGIVVMQWTMPTGQASGVHPGTGIISLDDNLPYCLDENGVVWWLLPMDPWTAPGAGYDPPVLVSQIKFWNRWYVITTDNIAWHSNGNNWTNLGPWPGGPVQSKSETWGRIKGKYEGKK